VQEVDLSRYTLPSIIIFSARTDESSVDMSFLAYKVRRLRPWPLASFASIYLAALYRALLRGSSRPNDHHSSIEEGIVAIILLSQSVETKQMMPGAP
jgi:hypothetical protein